MNVVEPARLFESMVRGPHLPRGALHRLAHLRHLLGSHVVTDLKAIERVFGVQVSDRHACPARASGVNTRSSVNHATHLFVFGRPRTSWARKASFPWPTIDPALFDQALGL